MIMNMIMKTFKLLALSVSIFLLSTSCCLYGPKTPIQNVTNSGYNGEKLGKYIANDLFVSLIKAPEFLFIPTPQTLFFEKFSSEKAFEAELNSQIMKLLRNNYKIRLQSTKTLAKYVLRADAFTLGAKVGVKLSLVLNGETLWSYDREFEDHR